MVKDIELTHKIFKILEVRLKKSEIIQKQKYEEAAALRDTERTLLYKAGEYMKENKMMPDDLDVEGFGQGLINIEEYLNEYLIINYGLSYKDVGTPIALLRHLKLNDLGI